MLSTGICHEANFVLMARYCLVPCRVCCDDAQFILSLRCPLQLACFCALTSENLMSFGDEKRRGECAAFRSTFCPAQCNQAPHPHPTPSHPPNPPLPLSPYTAHVLLLQSCYISHLIKMMLNIQGSHPELIFPLEWLYFCLSISLMITELCSGLLAVQRYSGNVI